MFSGGRLLFAADDGVSGNELWVVDPGASAQAVGTSCSAQPARMLRPGLGRSGAGLGGNRARRRRAAGQRRRCAARSAAAAGHFLEL
ncbi:MAG: hypothetical protein AAF628_19520 [Planctomycetota bacterium]